MTAIIGDRGKRRRYDPDLAEKVNAEVRRGKASQAEIEEICRNYEKFMEGDPGAKAIVDENKDPVDLRKEHPIIENSTKEAILEFSRRLVEYKDRDNFFGNSAGYGGAGWYLTALLFINENPEFEFDLTELNKEGILLDKIGTYIKNKKLIVHGNVGDNAGTYADNSRIIVNGDARDWIGSISKVSEIIVNGDAGKNVGSMAENSKIYVKGKIESLSPDIGEGTEVYQDKNGEKVLVYLRRSLKE